MIRYVDLFCGLGAFHTALSRYNSFKCVFASDIDNNIQEIYKKNYNITPYGDIHKYIDKIPDFDLLCAGFPCQPFSIAGKQQGFENHKSGNLFYTILKIIDLKQPNMCILENVKNLETHNGGETLKTIYNELDKRGYKVSHKIINSSECGSPQSRKRIFIVASKDKLITISYNKLPPKNVRSILDNISDQSNLYWNSDRHVLKSKHTTIKNLYNPRILYDIYSKDTDKGGRQGERVYSIDNTGVTICASSGGPGSKTGLYLMDDGTIRKLSLLETKRMFGFPDLFDMLNIPDERAKFYFGNSIVINVIQSIITSIYTDLND